MINNKLRFTALLLTGLIISAVNETELAAAQNKKLIKVEITTYFGDKQTYKQGDVLSFLVSLDQNAYLLLIYQDASGDLYQILPNRYRKNNFYQEGLFVPVPDQDEPFRFRVSPPFGEETLWAFASDKKFPELAGQELPSGLKKLSLNLTSVLAKVRSKSKNIYYGETKTVIRTEPK